MKKLTRLMLGVAVIAVTSAAAHAETLKLYTWREQEKPLWDYISENDVLGDIDIEVVWIQGENYDSKLRIDLGSNEPDLFQGRAGANWLQTYIDAGVIVPQTGLALDNMGAASLSAAQGKDGQIYGVPFAVQMESIIYNKKVFADNGISDSFENLEQLEAAFAKLKDAGVTPMAFGAAAGWWLNQVTGEVMTAGLMSDQEAAALIDGSACFTDDAFVATLEAVDRWNKAGYLGGSPLADDYGAMRTAVALGEAAMMIDGVWSSGPASPMYQIDPELELGFMAVPGKNGKVYAFGDGSYLANSKSDKQDAIAKVMQFTTTKEFAELFAQKVGELPAYGKDYNIDDARLKQVASMIANNALSVTPFFANSLNDGSPNYGELVAVGYQELVAGDISAADLAQKIQDGLNSWSYVGAKNCN